MNDIILKVEGLKVRIGEKFVINGVDLEIARGKVLALVGESGSGKTLTGLAALDLLPEGSVREGGAIFLRGRDIFSMEKEEKRKMRGKDIAMVFQEPFTAMNPVMSVGDQIREVFDAHFDISGNDTGRKIKEVLNSVRLPDSLIKSYPHELSGGMRQRAMLAMAIACSPDVLILDEPTTALDVSIQKEMLDLIRQLQEKKAFAALFITHDFSVVNMVADNVAVMKEGRIIECGLKEDVLRSPREKYTKKLIGCVPRIGVKQRRLLTDV
ncbi:MAG: ABC transporter ATP-binding protein [Candidatus Omnitrophota bacterium]